MKEDMNENMKQDTPLTGSQITKPQTPAYRNETIQKIVETFPVFGFSSFLYGIFFCFCLYENMCSYTSVLVCIATIAYFLVCFKKLEITSHQMKLRTFYIVCICLLGLSNMLTASNLLIFFNYIGILLLLFCFLISHFYDTKAWDFSKYTASLIQTMFCSIGQIHYPFKSFEVYYKKNQKLKNSKLLYVITGLLISVPLLLVIGSLLLSADIVFRNMADTFILRLFENFDFGTLFGICITILIGLVFSYGILIELCEKRINPHVSEKKTMEPIIAITFTSVLTLVYLCFSVIQILYLFIGHMQLPNDYTYAQYAREGFFQLLFVCIINLVLVLFCMSHYRNNKALKVILTILCGCTYIMIASSTMRMLMYIGSYHLTFLRVFVLLTLFVLFLCLTGVVISIFKPEFPLFHYMLVIVSVSYLVFSLSKPDYHIATYNINAGSKDPYYMYELSPDAAPVLGKHGYLYEVEGGSAPAFSSDYYLKRDYIRRCQESYENINLRRFNVSIYLAGQEVKNISISK